MFFNKPVFLISNFIMRNIIKYRAQAATPLLLIFSNVYSILPALIQAHGYSEVIKSLRGVYSHIQPIILTYVAQPVIRTAQRTAIIRNISNLRNPRFIANNPMLRALSPILVNAVIDAIIPRVSEVIKGSDSVNRMFLCLKLLKYTMFILIFSGTFRFIFKTTKLLISLILACFGISTTDIIPSTFYIKEFCINLMSYLYSLIDFKPSIPSDVLTNISGDLHSKPLSEIKSGNDITNNISKSNYSWYGKLYHSIVYSGSVVYDSTASILSSVGKYIGGGIIGLGTITWIVKSSAYFEPISDMINEIIKHL